MKKEEILQQVKKALALCIQNQNGYTAVSQLGIALSKNGFNFREYNYTKLIELLNDYPNDFDISNAEAPSQHPYVKIIDSGETIIQPTNGITIENKYIKREHLDFDGWGIIIDCQKKLEILARMALEENWYYGKSDLKEFSILKNYLLFTFKKLNTEKNKILSSAEYAVFNTGLVNSRYDPIYAIFEKNKNERVEGKKYNEWIFLVFAAESDRRWGMVLGNNFNPLPERANYFNNAQEMYFDTNQKEIALSDDHIIFDHPDRYPIDFLIEHLGSYFDIDYISNLPKEDKEIEFEKLKSFLKNKKNERIVINMRNRLKDAIEIAIKRIQWNFKTAIPLYFVRDNKMSLLIPLSLLDDTKVDIALVVSKLNAGGYRGMTIFTLEQAYTCARLVTRPDSDWLIAEKIMITDDMLSIS